MMRVPRANLRLTVLIVVLLALRANALCGPYDPQPKPAPQAGTPRQLLLVHYMPWYFTQPTWGMHWTGPQRQHDPSRQDADGMPDIWSHFHPLIGIYDSRDAEVIECQLLQMKLAGIDGVIIDWYGIAGAADYSPIHEAAQAVVEGVQKLGMKFAVCFEDRTVEYLVQTGKLKEREIQDHLVQTLQWLQENWFTSASYVRLSDRPLLLIFGPIYVQDAGTWNTAFGALPVRPQFFALHHLWRDVGANGGFAWVHPRAWQGHPTRPQIINVLAREFAAASPDPRQLIASAIPGFRDVYQRSHPTVDHRQGATLRESLAFALQGRWPIVQLVTWNDYGEGTMIEPTHEFGHLFLEIIQQARRRQLRVSFPYRAEDLRLPGELFALRKANRMPAEDLDQIVTRILRGEMAEARAAMEGSMYREPPINASGRHVPDPRPRSLLRSRGREMKSCTVCSSEQRVDYSQSIVRREPYPAGCGIQTASRRSCLAGLSVAVC